MVPDANEVSAAEQDTEEEVFDALAAIEDLRPNVTEAIAFVRSAKERLGSWLGASVAAYNAGGIIAALSVIKDTDDRGWSLTAFGVALMLCFGTGLAVLIATDSIETDLDAVSDRIAKLTEQDLVSDSFTAALQKLTWHQAKYYPAIFLGLAAVSLSVIASVLFVIFLPVENKTDQRRCAMVEREMMRGQPRRSDLPDLFQALGCRPQTDIMPRRSE